MSSGVSWSADITAGANSGKCVRTCSAKAVRSLLVMNSTRKFTSAPLAERHVDPGQPRQAAG